MSVNIDRVFFLKNNNLESKKTKRHNFLMGVIDLEYGKITNGLIITG